MAHMQRCVGLLFSAPTSWCNGTRQFNRSLASVAQNDGIHINRIAGSLGAVISHVDIRNLKALQTNQIRQALLENKVIFFHDQHLTPGEFSQFCAHFGKPIEYPFLKGIAGNPEIIEVLKEKHEKNNFGGIWHCDTLYLPEPPMGTILHAQEVPPFGGDTLFANQVAAYETLSNGLQRTLDTLTCVNTSAKADVTKTREDRLKNSTQEPEDLESRHPAVRTHPETWRKSLYINIAHTERFDGWTTEESAPLLLYLHQHQVRPEFMCRFQWKPGSIAFWDNRQALHNPINDYHGYRRRMHRITLAGDAPK